MENELGEILRREVGVSSFKGITKRTEKWGIARPQRCDDCAGDAGRQQTCEVQKSVATISEAYVVAVDQEGHTRFGSKLGMELVADPHSVR